MFDAWLNSEVFRTVVATGLFFVVCVVLLVVLLAYLHFAKRLSEPGSSWRAQAGPSDALPDVMDDVPLQRVESQASHVEIVSARDARADQPAA